MSNTREVIAEARVGKNRVEVITFDKIDYFVSVNNVIDDEPTTQPEALADYIIKINDFMDAL